MDKKPEEQSDAIKEPSTEYQKFESAMKQILSVPKEAIQSAEETPVYAKRKRRAK